MITSIWASLRKSRDLPRAHYYHSTVSFCSLYCISLVQLHLQMVDNGCRLLLGIKRIERDRVETAPRKLIRYLLAISFIIRVGAVIVFSAALRVLRIRRLSIFSILQPRWLQEALRDIQMFEEPDHRRVWYLSRSW
ncbi:hypothetical protein K438DRAFT_854767 [Mycena galopus ATCC 62051]|nr:hypothetical protein K438DRAFT_854767 [Mycena galopus ATCC 62051]